MIRVLIVDDDDFVRAGLTALLGASDGIDVVGQCGDGCDVRSMVDAVRPDVVVMDQQMPDMSGLEAATALRATHPAVRILMVTGSPRTAALLRATDDAVIAGWLSKGGHPHHLVEAVRSAHLAL